MSAARVVFDPPASGTWNMAVDEVLLHSAAAGRATLRFYQWSEPTLSLGYFQALADRDSHAASRDCPLVRRASGGGAILHDRELTYSFAAPLAERLSAQATALYELFHASLVLTLAEFGVPATPCPPEPRDAAPPFLCFQRRSPGDVLCGAAKIAGSAQRRQRGGLLQHGSILLGQSPHAPELPGIEQLTGVAIAPAELAARWAGRLLQELGGRFMPFAGSRPVVAAMQGGAWLSERELVQAAAIERSRFAAAAWTARREKTCG